MEAEFKTPDSVPVLVGRDICKGMLSGASGTHCLLGWSREVFGVIYPMYFKEHLLNAIRRIDPSYQGRGIASWNDSPSNSTSKIARAWNLATAMYGYTEGNPQAKHLGAT